MKNKRQTISNKNVLGRPFHSELSAFLEEANLIIYIKKP